MKKKYKAIVLDLDETLVNTVIGTKCSVTNNYDGYFNVDNQYIVHIRPFMTEFMSFIIAYFETIYVYTAGTKEYANTIVDEIFPNKTIAKLLDRAYCEIIENEGKSAVYKKLPPELDLDTTLVVDDRIDVVSKNTVVKANTDNFYQIPLYNCNQRGVDYELMKLMDFITQKTLETIKTLQ